MSFYVALSVVTDSEIGLPFRAENFEPLLQCQAFWHRPDERQFHLDFRRKNFFFFIVVQICQPVVNTHLIQPQLFAPTD